MRLFQLLDNMQGGNQGSSTFSERAVSTIGGHQPKSQARYDNWIERTSLAELFDDLPVAISVFKTPIPLQLEIFLTDFGRRGDRSRCWGSGNP